jgi:hypothetical protein
MVDADEPPSSFQKRVQCYRDEVGAYSATVGYVTIRSPGTTYSEHRWLTYLFGAPVLTWQADDVFNHLMYDSHHLRQPRLQNDIGNLVFVSGTHNADMGQPKRSYDLTEHRALSNADAVPISAASAAPLLSGAAAGSKAKSRASSKSRELSSLLR